MIQGAIYDNTLQKQADNELQQQNRTLTTINQIALEFASLPKDKPISELIVKKLMQLSGAVMTLFSLYNPSDQSLHILDIEISPD
jgi:hypothetical protein